MSWILRGILLANAQGADVISLSLGAGIPRNFPGGGGAAIWSAFNRIINFVTSNGSVVVASAGNGAADVDRLKAVVLVPADSPGAISVTATTNPDLLRAGVASTVRRSTCGTSRRPAPAEQRRSPAAWRRWSSP